MYTRDEIFSKVADVLVTDFECKPEQLKPDARLVEDLDLDSIDAIDLIVKLQKFFNKKASPDDFKEMKTLQDLTIAIEKVMNDN